MTGRLTVRLISAAASDHRIRRKDKVERMAKDLIRYDAVADERDAIRSLVFSGLYSAVDVMMLVDDARQVAMQEIVAREMSRS